MASTLVKSDFGGYATKANLECTDGRTIMPEAFQHMDGKKVPLVWQHGHKDPTNVLGHVMLEARPDGVYAHGYFNETPQGQTARALVQHEDVNALSIYANQLVERAKQVYHGIIREVSLCLAGANPGAYIDNVTIAHGDGSFDELEDTVIMHFGQDAIIDYEVEEDENGEPVEHATVKEVYDTLTDEQKDVVNFMIGAALEANNPAEHSDGDPNGDPADDTEDENLKHQEGTDMTRNIFEQGAAGGDGKGGSGTLQHSMTVDDIRGIIKHADQVGSLKQAVESYALAHGITDIDMLFPEAKNLTQTPEFDKRRTEWVAGVLGGVGKSPFAKVRSVVADITMDEARALGYIKGNFKKEEWFGLTARTTGPTTIYKKQKLDRDDIIDITDFDVVAWMKAEMRLMLEEEIAGAILIGDGRPVEDPDNAGQPNPDKIKDPGSAIDGTGIRSILNEHELYAPKVNFALDESDPVTYQGLVEEVMLSMDLYKGTGTPTFYTTQRTLTKMLLTKDQMGRRLWRTKADLAAEMGVDNIVPVEIFARVPDLIGIIVNLSDYNVGTDRGGEVTFFDDFDIDYNQYKYLGETRLSGALKKIRSALVIRKVDATDTLVTPNAPTFNEDTGVVTIPTQTGVVYKNADTDATLSAGPQTALAVGATLNVVAEPANDTYYFANSEVDDWKFTRPTA